VGFLAIGAWLITVMRTRVFALPGSPLNRRDTRNSDNPLNRRDSLLSSHQPPAVTMENFTRIEE